MTKNYFELAPAAVNPPYPGGPYVGCCAAVCADFITAYTGTPVTDLGALFASMTKRHRNVDPSCNHGIPDHGACAYCIFLELYARGLPVAYAALDWTQITAAFSAGHYVALAGMYGKIPWVSASSYSSTIPAEGRSDVFSGAHMVCAFGSSHAQTRVQVLDPDFGNQRGTPPYSLLHYADVGAYWQSLSYAVTYATRAPSALPAPSHTATVRTPSTRLYNPVTRKWVYSLKVGTVLTVGGHASMQGGKSCVPVRGPDPYGGYWVPVANVRIV